jgi:hypothetical protein
MAQGEQKLVESMVRLRGVSAEVDVAEAAIPPSQENLDWSSRLKERNSSRELLRVADSRSSKGGDGKSCG